MAFHQKIIHVDRFGILYASIALSGLRENLIKTVFFEGLNGVVAFTVIG